MTIKIELIREDALPLLRYLEQLKVLRVLLPDTAKMPKKEKPKSHFSGRISADTAKLLHKQLAEMREEWK